jgi:hypothetical protein
MQVNELEQERNILDRVGEPWTDEEDQLLFNYRINNKTPKEIGVLLKRSEFAINLRIHLIIYRLHRSGVSPNQIRLLTNAELSQILEITKPVESRKSIQKQGYNDKFDWTNIWNIWNIIWYSL